MYYLWWISGVQNVHVRIIPSQELIRIGDNVELNCDVEGDPQPQIRWNKMHNGEFQDNVQILGSRVKIRDVRNENGNWSNINIQIYIVQWTVLIFD